MKNNSLAEIVSIGALAIVAFFLVNPMEVWMPTPAHMALLAAAVVLFGAFAVFVLRERAGDERESEHRSFAGRIAFLVGSAVLLIAIVAQSLAHMLDPWLVVALIVMLLGKSAAHAYSARYR